MYCVRHVFDVVAGTKDSRIKETSGSLLLPHGNEGRPKVLRDGTERELLDFQILIGGKA